MFGIISYLVIITSLVISPGIGTLPPPRLIFLSPTTTTPHISHTSCVYFHVQISQIPYPFMHLLELSVFTLPDSPDDEPELLGISSKFISPGSDLHSSSLNRRKRKEMAKKALQDYPNLIKYSNQRTEFDDSDGDLWVSEPEDMKFVARGLKNGHYRAVCKLKRRMIKSDVGVVLPPLIPTEVDVKFDVEQYDINIKMTHLNNAEINNVTTSSSTPAIGSGNGIDIPLTYFSTTPSLLINFTASMQRKTNFEGGTKGNDNMNNIMIPIVTMIILYAYIVRVCACACAPVLICSCCCPIHPLQRTVRLWPSMLLLPTYAATATTTRRPDGSCST